MQLIFGELPPGQISARMMNYDIRTRQYGVGRSLIALAQMTILLLTPYSALMQTVIGQGPAPHCVGIRAMSSYCLMGSSPAWVPTGVMILILLAVISGLLPTPMAALHAWVSFSLLVSTSLPDGGDQAAAVVCLLLVIVSVADNRRWIGDSGAGPIAPWRKQLSLAGTLLLRIQIAALYFDSAIGKLFTADWVNGTAEYYILRDPYFGASGPIADLLEKATHVPVITVGLTWGALLVEVSIATLVLCGPKARRAGLLLCLLLHGFIIATIGLWSFGLIMIGAVTVATLPTVADSAGRPRLLPGLFRGEPFRWLPKRTKPSSSIYPTNRSFP